MKIIEEPAPPESVVQTLLYVSLLTSRHCALETHAVPLVIKASQSTCSQGLGERFPSLSLRDGRQVSLWGS